MSVLPGAPPAPPSPAPATTLGTKLSLAAADIKLHHSVFALPFAVLGAFLARPAASTAGRFAGQLALVVACMVAARTWAMLVNRLADAGFDAANPRTARRAVASGRLSVRDARVLAAAAALAFVACCGLFWVLFTNPWPVALSPLVLGWLALYSYAKRFTAWCHVLLGTALAISPLAAAIAVDPAALTRVPALFALSAMVTLWVAGFDIVYALQDEAFDRSAGLHSIPAAMGKSRAVLFSRALHALAVGALVAVILLEPRLRTLFPPAVALVVGVLVAEHVILQRRGLTGLPLVFFTLNGVVSCLLGAAGLADLLLAA